MGHRIIFGCYRDWTIDVRRFVMAHPNVSDVRYVSTNSELAEVVNSDQCVRYDFVLLCGWSGQPYKSVLDSIPVFSEHPVSAVNSDRYSLGTPLQNQILDGVKQVKHRLVKVSFPELELRQWSHEVDMSLAGSMDNILDQMRVTSINLFDQFLNDYPYVSWEEWDAVSPGYMAVPRQPRDSLLTHTAIGAMTTRELYDFCRMLEGPYPRAQLEDEHGILTFEKVSYKVKKQ